VDKADTNTADLHIFKLSYPSLSAFGNLRHPGSIFNGSISFGVGILILQIGSIEFMTPSVLLFPTLQNKKI